MMGSIFNLRRWTEAGKAIPGSLPSIVFPSPPRGRPAGTTVPPRPPPIFQAPPQARAAPQTNRAPWNCFRREIIES
jgi:hypothetical protein